MISGLTHFKVFFLFLILSSCTFSQPPLLRVGFKTWSLKDFKAELDSYLKAENHSPPSSKKGVKVKKQVLNDLILTSLIENWMKKNKKKFSKQKKLGNFPKIPLKTKLAYQKKQALHQKLLLHLEPPNPPAKEAWRYYKSHKQEFFEAETCLLKQIFVSSHKKALLLKQRIKKGVAFEKLSDLYSEKEVHPLWIKKGQWPLFDRACFSKNSALIQKSHFGYHLFEVKKRNPAKQKSFKQVKQIIFKKLKEKHQKQAFESWLKKEVASTDVFINEKLFNQISFRVKKL